VSDDYTRVNFGNMELKQAELTKLVEQFQTTYDDMVTELRTALGGDGGGANNAWAGEAQGFFETIRTKWHQQAGEMREELNNAQLAVGIARDNYQHAEKLNSGMWSRDA
jgi:uncharacterized protein YukE